MLKSVAKSSKVKSTPAQSLRKSVKHTPVKQEGDTISKKARSHHNAETPTHSIRSKAPESKDKANSQAGSVRSEHEPHCPEEPEQAVKS